MSIKRQHYTKRKSYNNIARKNQITNTTHRKTFCSFGPRDPTSQQGSCDLPVKTAEMQ